MSTALAAMLSCYRAIPLRLHFLSVFVPLRDDLLRCVRLTTGFGRTEVPKDLSGYSYKSISIAMNELAAQLGETQIILG